MLAAALFALSVPLGGRLQGAAVGAMDGAAEGGRALPRPHEQLLETGARVVVMAPLAELPPDRVELQLALPFGWADDASPAGSGLARLVADHVTLACGEPRVEVELLPTVLLLRASSSVGEVEKLLSGVVDALTGARLNDESFAALLAAPAPSPVDPLLRWREAATPQSGEGLGAARRRPEAPTQEELRAFLAARCGCEGATLALVTAADAPPLLLTAGRVLERLPRAKGVAAPWVRELPAALPRRVAAPTGASDDTVGLRIAWSDDRNGDRLALATAFLAAAAGRSPTWVERDRQGGLVAFADSHRDGALATTLARAVVALHAEGGLSETAFEALLSAFAADVERTLASPVAQARQLALDGTLDAAPFAAALRAARWRARGRAAAEAALRELLRPQALVEVVASRAEAGR